MKCLCCGKPLNTDKELKSLWHNSCINKFFSTKKLPELDLSNTSLETLAIASVNKGYTIPGVQKSSHYIYLTKILLILHS